MRIDQLRGEGAAGGVAKLLRGGAGAAAAPADESEEEEAAAAGAGGGTGADSADGSDGEMDVVLQSGDEEEAQEVPSASKPAQQQQQQKGEKGVREAQQNGELAAAAGAAAAVRERYGTARLSASWPRAAWFLRGQGRWGLKQVREQLSLSLWQGNHVCAELGSGCQHVFNSINQSINHNSLW